MNFFADGDLVPTAYDGKEQAYIKHELLKAYLQTLFLIIGMGGRGKKHIELCYVDCFAGPWADESDSLSSTSIAISLQILDSCVQKLRKLGVVATVRALYVEENPTAFVRLQKFLETATPLTVQSECLCGDFVKLRQPILDWTGADAFTFFFIDPKGWTGIEPETLRPLLQRPRSEFLVNFMYDFINRIASMQKTKQVFADVIGEPLDLSELPSAEREHLLLQTYRKNLKSNTITVNRNRPPRSAHVRIMDPSKDRPKYHLVYVTTHPEGIIRFMDIFEKVDLVQKQVRAIKKNTKREAESRTKDMFGSPSLVDESAGRASPEDVDAYWCARLESGPVVINREVFADILEEKDWFPSDLQESLTRLIKSRKVVNLTLDATRRPKRPLHFEHPGGEKLSLIQS